MSYEVKKIKRIVTKEMGALQFFEANKDIPFDIKRIYYISQVPKNVQRGAHAHKKLQQLLFCPYGSISIILDDGKKRTSILLNKPDIGLFITPCVWRDMLWNEENSVLCVAASDYYNEDDYIRDYDDFLKYIENTI